MFFVRFLSTISRQPTGRFTPNFACGRTLVPGVSSPLLGVSGPRRAEKDGNEIFVTIGANGEFVSVLLTHLFLFLYFFYFLFVPCGGLS